MPKITARPVGSAFSFPYGSEVVSVAYKLGVLAIHVKSAVSDESVIVEFVDTVGFRVLDERDLMEYWPECSKPSGWLFEITTGGWLSQEASREAGFFVRMNPEVKAYLISGEDDCVSVICRNMPAVLGNAR